MARFLIEYGENFNAKNTFNHTPLHLVSKSGNLEIVQRFIEKGAHMEVRNLSA